MRKTKNIYWQYHCEKAELEWLSDEVIKINDVKLNRCTFFNYAKL